MVIEKPEEPAKEIEGPAGPSLSLEARERDFFQQMERGTGRALERIENVPGLYGQVRRRRDRLLAGRRSSKKTFLPVS